MRDFFCPCCTEQLAFEASACPRCGSAVGFDLRMRAFALLTSEAATPLQHITMRCVNAEIARCNWLVPAEAPGLCQSCALTRTRPSDADEVGLVEFAAAETAKRRLVMELTELGLPLATRDADSGRGVCFDLLSSEYGPVVTGHESGVITLDLRESDDQHREQLRTSLDEPYRTLLGHLRHEIGHYFYPTLVATASARRQFDSLFGDPGLDYEKALRRHYRYGPPAGWEQTFISAYASMHPAEDWAETFAHYLYIRDTLDTAAAFGFAPAGLAADRLLVGGAGFDRLIDIWRSLTWSLNMINRSMGNSDLYPFTLVPAAVKKIRLVHDLVTANHPRVRR